jgi:hypothetical protein
MRVTKVVAKYSCYHNDQIKEDGMETACTTHGKEMHTEFGGKT